MGEMTDRPTDSQLLRDYASGAAPDAFAQLARRHLPLVYTVALRSVGNDPHLAEDVTQAVFMVLHRKAHRIPGGGSLLAGWLVQTTRYAAGNALRRERRRRFHERRAAAMKSLTSDAHGSADPVLAPLVHEGLAALSSLDRTAVVLRYFHGLPARDIGADLGISEQAAQKRIVRALEKIRGFLSRHGVTTHELALEGALRSEASCAVPAGLIATVISASTQPVLHTAGFSIAKAALKAMSLVPVKVAMAAAVVVVAVSGGAKILLTEPTATAAPPAPAQIEMADFTEPVAPPSTAPTTLPSLIPLANDGFTLKAGNQNDGKIGLDPTVMRSGAPAMLSSSTSREWGKSTMAVQVINPAPFAGKRLRYSAYVKTAELVNWAGLIMVVLGPNGQVVVSDDMCDRSISQNVDWTKLEIVSDVPADATKMICGSVLYGAGRLWLDGAQLEAVADNIGTTDDQKWRTWSFSRPKYTQILDFATLREGNPTICISATTPASGEWCEWAVNDRHAERYAGKRLRVTAWMMTEGATGPTGFTLRFQSNAGKDLVSNPGKRPIRGTTEWTRYEQTIEVPPETFHIIAGVRLGGSGKLWVNDIKIEYLEPDGKPVR
jgi:RNA polymerase sigma factor (sigma-70 family)